MGVELQFRGNCTGILASHGSYDIDISGNTVSHNDRIGITVTDSHDNTVISNEADDNGAADLIEEGFTPFGVWITNSYRNVIALNHASGTKAKSNDRGDGIGFADATDNLVFGNTANRNAGAGIRIRGTNPEGIGNVLLVNTAQRNVHLADLVDDNVNPKDDPRVCINRWQFNTFNTDNEGDPNPRTGCIK